MHRRVAARCKIIFACALGLLALSYCIFERSPQPQFEVSLSRVVGVHDAGRSLDWRFPIEDTNDDCVVTIRVHNLSSRMLTLGNEVVQPKVSGEWLPAKQVAWLNSKYFVATVPGGSESEFVAAVVPRHTEVVRLRLDYRYETSAHRWSDRCFYYPLAARGTCYAKLLDWAAPRLRKMLDRPRFQHWIHYGPVTYELTLLGSAPAQPRPSDQPEGSANPGQPVGSETNRTSAVADLLVR